MKDELPGTVRFLFQPAEEVGKGAKAVVAQGGMEGVDAAFGIHCSVQTPVGPPVPSWRDCRRRRPV